MSKLYIPCFKYEKGDGDYFDNIDVACQTLESAKKYFEVSVLDWRKNIINEKIWEPVDIDAVNPRAIPTIMEIEYEGP